MKIRDKYNLFSLLSLLLGMSLAACGATIQIIDVDVKLPAAHPLHFSNREIAVFNALYDSADTWNDSLLINKVAEGFRDQLATDFLIDVDSIPVFNHFCGQTALGVLEDKEYIYALSEQTGARTLVLIDSLKSGDMAHVQYRVAAASELRPNLVTAEWQMVFRFFDMDSDRFIARYAFKDTLFWNILAKDQDSLLVYTKLASSLPETAYYLGSAVARMTQPQWETQERVLFFFSGSSWYKAMEHAFMFEWEEAQQIWLSLTKSTKNTKKIAFAAYNLAVASEMMGHIDLAKEWLDLARKYLNIPEINHYLRMLEERGQQQQVILLH